MAKYGVYKRGERWKARPWVPGRGHKYVKGSFDEEHEAIAAAIELIKTEQLMPAHKETIASFAARWITDFPRPKESTEDSYRAAAKRFANTHGTRRLHDFTVAEAMAWARKHRTEAAYLRVFFNDARKAGLLPRTFDNPFSALGISKGKGRRDIVAITLEELDLLADLALEEHGEDFGPVFRALVLFAAYTTMRPSEIFGLNRSDVKAEEIVIDRQFYKRRIQDPKYGKRRLPFIPPEAQAALDTLPRRVPAPRCPITDGAILFPGKLDQRISQSSMSGYWKPVRVAFEANLPTERRAELRAARDPEHPHMDFYELRHFGATLMAEMGVEPWVAAKMMGHVDGGALFSKLYSHPRDEIARERLKRAYGQNVRELRALDGGKEATG